MRGERNGAWTTASICALALSARRRRRHGSATGTSPANEPRPVPPLPDAVRQQPRREARLRQGARPLFHHLPRRRLGHAQGQRTRVQVATGSQTRQLQAVATEHGIAMIDLHGDATFQQNLSDSGALGLRRPRRALCMKLPAGHSEAFGRWSGAPSAADACSRAAPRVAQPPAASSGAVRPGLPGCRPNPSSRAGCGAR
jgi:hypothetical protein